MRGAPDISLRAYLERHGALAPEHAALLVVRLADRLVVLHSQGKSCFPLPADTILVGAQDSPLDPHSAVLLPSHTTLAGRPPADEIQALGFVLAELIGFRSSVNGPTQPPSVPDELWSLVGQCIADNPVACKDAAHIAGQLRYCARDLMLGTVSSPPQDDLSGQSVPPGPGAAWSSVPAYVPGPESVTPVPSLAPRRKHQATLLAAATAAAVILAIVGVAVTRPSFLTAQSPPQVPLATSLPNAESVPPLAPRETTQKAKQPAMPPPGTSDAAARNARSTRITSGAAAGNDQRATAGSTTAGRECQSGHPHQLRVCPRIRLLERTTATADGQIEDTAQHESTSWLRSQRQRYLADPLRPARSLHQCRKWRAKNVPFLYRGSRQGCSMGPLLKPK